jgi:hypothetical protein
MAERKPISKKLRFEVFKRDSFTCQYCGKKAPDVLLVIDHIRPISNGGTNDILNLITACQGCNSGKSNRVLSDQSVIEKQRRQLQELQERKEQIEMMFEWQKELINLDEQTCDMLAGYWGELVQPYNLTEHGRTTLKQYIRKFGIDETMIAMKIATETYLQLDKQGIPTQDSVNEAWQKVGGICFNRKRDRESPHMSQIYRLLGIMEKSLSYVKWNMAMQLLHRAIKLGADIDDLEVLARTAGTWTNWYDEITMFLDSVENKET